MLRNIDSIINKSVCSLRDKRIVLINLLIERQIWCLCWERVRKRFIVNNRIPCCIWGILIRPICIASHKTVFQRILFEHRRSIFLKNNDLVIIHVPHTFSDLLRLMNGLSFIQKVIEMLRQLFLLQLFVPYRHIPRLSESALKVAPDCHEKEEAENDD